MGDQKNLVMAIVLSILVLVGTEYLFGGKRSQTPPSPAETTAPAAVPAPASAPTPGAANSEAAPHASAQPASPASPLPAQPARGEGGRITIETPSIKGSIALLGARIDDVTLTLYRETVDPKSPPIGLFEPAGAKHPYHAETGWVAGEGVALKLPDADSLWRADRDRLSPEMPVTLTWDNGEGLRFERRIAIDAEYMFQVTDRVTNATDKPVALIPYALLSRTGKPAVQGMYILHEGPLGVFDGTLKEATYKDLDEAQGGTLKMKSTGGWAGITDKYWLAALAPAKGTAINARFLHQRAQTTDKYQVDILNAQAKSVAPGETAENATHIFAGVKQVEMLDRYAFKLGIDRFDLAIDFGWFYFLTKPFFYILQVLNTFLGNFGLAILGLTICVKIVLYPLADKSYKAMSKMKGLQPELKKLQERFGDDRTRLNQEMMALYKREKVNPMAGCLPIVVQIPIFFALYKVLFVTIEMRHAPFYGWIHDLSAPDPTTLFNLFGLVPWTPPEYLMIGVWPLIMGVTMFLQQKLNPQPADPVQAKVFMVLPFVFTFMLANFSAGLVIYWAWNNVLSIAQQWLIMRRMGVKVSS